MKTIITLILAIILVIFLALLHSSGALGESEGPEVEIPEGGMLQESLTIAPNDFDINVNYSYERIDQYAVNAPPSAEASVDSLASYLAAPARNEREKARSIFRWVAENIDYDELGYFKGTAGTAETKGSLSGTSSKDILRTRKSVCDGYSDLFLSLASSAGLDAVKIAGYGKGYGYLPGENLSGPLNHAWNAVKINGSWYLIDCTWGAGYIDENKKYVRKFDDHYFMTPPSEFIYDHFPEDTAWQLLKHPLSKSEFEKLVFLKSEFYKYGLKLGDHSEGTIRADKRINVSVYAPNDVLLISDLRYLDGSLPSDGTRNYTFCERDGDRYDIFMQFPRAGSYILRVCAKHRNEPGEYHEVIEYGIDVAAGDLESPGFPMTYGKFTEAGAHLCSPMEGELKSGTSYWFSISVPEAENVTVVCGDEWSYLNSTEDQFQGNVTVAKGDVLVAAKFQKESYDVLLKYVGY